MLGNVGSEPVAKLQLRKFVLVFLVKPSIVFLQSHITVTIFFATRFCVATI